MVERDLSRPSQKGYGHTNTSRNTLITEQLLPDVPGLISSEGHSQIACLLCCTKAAALLLITRCHIQSMASLHMVSGIIQACPKRIHQNAYKVTRQKAGSSQHSEGSEDLLYSGGKLVAESAPGTGL